MVLLPLGLEIGRSAGALVSGFHLPIAWALVDPRGQGGRAPAARYVESVRPPGSVVVTSPHVAWLYPAPVSDFLQAGRRRARRWPSIPPRSLRERSRFSPSLEPGGAGQRGGDRLPKGGREGAAFAVLDPYWDSWARESDVVARLTAEVERWPLVWSEGGVRVHRRPEAEAWG